MFFSSLIILRDILQPDYYNHFALFVRAVALLNSSSISKEDLVLSSLLMNQFVYQFADLYSVQHMTYNLHMALHLERCTKLLGPLWSVSCFPFEDINGRLSNLIHGTRHVGIQIYSNLSIITQLPLMIRSLKDGKAKEFCTSMAKKRYRLKVKEKVSPRVYVVGTFRPVSVFELSS